MTATTVPPQLTHRLVQVAYADPLILDCSLGDRFQFTLAGSPTITAVNLSDGQTVYCLVGSGAGGFTPTWDAAVFDFGVNDSTLSSDPDLIDHVGGIVIGGIVQVVPPSLGYTA